jgi:hypothetical protein
MVLSNYSLCGNAFHSVINPRKRILRSSMYYPNGHAEAKTIFPNHPCADPTAIPPAADHRDGCCCLKELPVIQKP